MFIFCDPTLLEKPLYVLKETDIKNYKGLTINEKQISQAMLIKQYYALVKINEGIPHLPMWLNLPNTIMSIKKNSIVEGYT